MRPSNKSRNRNKNNNNRRGAPGNNINRVFESAGPEGRVRGTPQQIIDKYLSLTYDSQLAGDRVSAENFQQHAEHYSRLLLEAQKELADKQSEQQSNVQVNGVQKNDEDKNFGKSKKIKEESEVDIISAGSTIVDFDKSIDKKNVKSKNIVVNPKTAKTRNSRKIVKKESLESSSEVEASKVE